MTAKLRALATAATEGPWFGPRITDAWPPGEWGVYAADDDGAPIPHAIIARMARDDDDLDNAAFIAEQQNNAAFIAAADPQTVIAILDQLDAARAALAEALDLFDAVCHAPRPDQLARIEVLRRTLCR